jgi:serine/threonine-protein kinase
VTLPALPKPHEPGEIFGPYRLERLLGRGAAAEVWLAQERGDMGFTKRQALKLLRPPPQELEAQKRALVNEARVCGWLKHPGIVDVYRVGEFGGELFIAMEYVDGPDLNTLLEGLRKQGTVLPVGVALDMAITLCEALDLAHKSRDDAGVPLQIVHRDLKPSNVLVDRRGLLKVSDWGLVKSTLNVDSTSRGVVKGTPGYIAPEVWGGTRLFRPAVDIFAVGAILWELIVGERLFSGRNLARIAEQVARRKPEEEAARVAELVPALGPVMAAMLQRVPEQRLQDAGELADTLRTIRDGLPDRGTLRSFLRRHEDLVQDLAPGTTGGMPAVPGSSSRATESAPTPPRGVSTRLISASPRPMGDAGATRSMDPSPGATAASTPPAVASAAAPEPVPPPRNGAEAPAPTAPEESTDGEASMAPSGPGSSQRPKKKRRKKKRKGMAGPPIGPILVAVTGVGLLLLGLAAVLGRH